MFNNKHFPAPYPCLACMILFCVFLFVNLRHIIKYDIITKAKQTTQNCLTINTFQIRRINAMNKNNGVVAGSKWSVSCTSGYVTGAVILNVFQLRGRKMQRASIDGLQFQTSEQAFDFAFAHGFLHQSGRNTASFTGNRSLRKHAGIECVESEAWRFGMKKRNAERSRQRIAELKSAGKW